MLFGLMIPQALQAEYRSMDIATNVKSRFSAGCSSAQELMTQAEFKGLDGILFGDHDRHSIQYGVPGLERILKVSIDYPSVLENGAAVYLSEVRQLDRSDDSVVLVPGVESAPFYYWTGNPLEQNLIAYHWDKHLWIVGLPNLPDYEELPVLNGGLSTRNWKENDLAFSIFAVGALIGLLALAGKRFRGTAFLFTVAMVLLAANHHPFKSSPFDQYQGDRGPLPYQYLIDYADSKGALVFWSHLETPVTKRMSNGMISFRMKTDAHPEDLLLTRHYTGFQAVDETRVAAVEPGREWDQVLLEYLSGQRDRPVWGYGSNNFRCEGKASLGGVRTVVWAASKDSRAVIEALRAGRMYGVKQGEGEQRLSLDRFELTDTTSGTKALMGENLPTGQAPEVAVHLSMTDGSSATAKIKLIRNGEVVRKAVLRLPVEDVWQDTLVELDRPAYYRLLVEVDDFNRLVSNPVFLNRDARRKAADVAAQPEPPPIPPAAEPITRPEPMVEIQPAQPAPEPATEATSPPPAPDLMVEQQFVEVTGNRVRLRKGPSTQFPIAGQVVKGERLVFIRETKMIFQGKPWVVIEKDGQKAYIWGGLVKGP